MQVSGSGDLPCNMESWLKDNLTKQNKTFLFEYDEDDYFRFKLNTWIGENIDWRLNKIIYEHDSLGISIDLQSGCIERSFLESVGRFGCMCEIKVTHTFQSSFTPTPLAFKFFSIVKIASFFLFVFSFLSYQQWKIWKTTKKMNILLITKQFIIIFILIFIIVYMKKLLPCSS